MTVHHRHGLRRGPAADWTSLNPVLDDGEEGYETDTHKRKVGDGETAWNDLAYDPSSASGVTSFNTRNGAVTLTKADVTGTGLAAGDVGAQPSDADLTTIAAISSATAGVLATDGAGWIRKTYAQLKTALGLTKGDVGLGNVDNTSDVNKPISTATQTALNAKADLVGGVIPTAQLPAIALSNAVTVASQAAMLALTTSQVQPGDLAVRTDGAGTFILTATDPSVLANWTRLNAPTDVVVSVNGQTGTVVLAKGDIGLGSVDNTADAAKNVLSATKLTTARTIDGQAFDGTANVTVVAPGTHAAASKATPVDADELPLVDSAASNVLKRLTWANLKATLKSYFDTLYATQTDLDKKIIVAPFTVSGAVTVRTGAGRFYVEQACTILSVRASVGTAPTGAALVVDVNKNGTTIFTTQANRPSIAAGSNAAGLVTNQDVTTLAAGDYLTVDVDQVGSTVAGSDLVVQIRLRP